MGRCIESVLSQDFTDFELLVRDNVSDDGTIAMLEDYARSDPRIALSVNDVNVGSHENMRLVLKDARGTLFRWISADGWLEPGCLSACVHALGSRPDAIGVTTWFTIHTGDRPARHEEYRGEFPSSPDPARRFERMLWFFHAGDAKYDPVYGPYAHYKPGYFRLVARYGRLSWRAHAVVVDHLVPPMTRAETYDDLARLEQLLDEYAQVQALDPAKLPAIQADVIRPEAGRQRRHIQHLGAERRNLHPQRAGRVRERLLPELVRATYTDAKAMLTAKKYQEAAVRFQAVLDLLRNADEPAFSETRALASQFLDLATLASDVNAAAVPVGTSGQSSPGTTETTTYDVSSTDVVPPTALGPLLPQPSPRAADCGWPSSSTRS